MAKKSLKFDYLDHTADVIIRAYGNSLNEALSNSILALSNLCIDLKFSLNNYNNLIEKEILIKSNSKESLFYDLLNEIIFIIDTEFIVPIIIDSKYEKLNENMCIYKAKLKCIPINETKIKGSVKSSTYNQMKIIEKENSFIIQTVVDL